ncbi:uncharacterized protein LOC102712306 [Oryza brachyantha]|uniref:uncharacterized protein LOC102712306 n=1 Tax=Oryza brachyantha TaxID=4533 RepID=UPI001ADD4A6E|nr:uncharacterized protein LOC102712306 [Oryza brachyantha]
MIAAVAAVAESPSPARKRCRLGGPVAMNGESGGGASVTSAAAASTSGGEFDLRHWRAGTGAKRAGSGMRRRWAPPEIEIPGGGGGGARGYTSLRDILSSPEYAASSKSSSPAADGGSGGGDVHMIRHPLVKHAAYAYLQLTPSARDVDAAGRRRRRSRGPLCRLLLGCLGFVGALFGR